MLILIGKKSNKIMITLGIESSCDETAVAIINSDGEILSHKLITQFKEHSQYGGVVPEIASRAHLDYVDILIKQAIEEANIKVSDIDVFSAGLGPGLIGGLIVGATIARAMAFALHKPFIPVNHLEAHALMPMFFDRTLKFPYLLLLVSGGHTQILVVNGVGDYDMLGTSIDDACGECFDKTAKLLGWNYMGGVEIEKCAKGGDENAFDFPRPLIDSKDLNFSFSGLKTAVRQTIEKIADKMTDKIKSDLCASFQKTICDVLSFKMEKAIVSGGVARNFKIRETLYNLSKKYNMKFAVADPKYCTDNGVMIAYAGEQNFLAGKKSDFVMAPKPRWPLEELKNG